MIYLLAAIGWLACAALSYVLIRRQSRQDFGEWTKSDRLVYLTMSLLFPPSPTLIVLVLWAFDLVDRHCGSPAKW